ncbi:pre-mRNA-splicing factor 38B-like isoform X2 [Dermacentor albipictus]|uniref:pre-mRNA-splicing factor 38B-like isoform X2 n=1 Tax=Dermacentor albipictus TaxID=60249 RepID=UPI0031FE12E7
MAPKRQRTPDSPNTKRQKNKERMRMRRLNMSPDAKAREAERKRKQRLITSPDAKGREAERKRQQRRAISPNTKANELERRRQQRLAMSPNSRAREAERRRRQRLAMSPNSKAREAERKRLLWLSQAGPSRRASSASGTRLQEGEGDRQPSPSTDDNDKSGPNTSSTNSSNAPSPRKLKIDATTQCAVLMTPKATMAVRTKRTSTVGLQTGRIVEQMGCSCSPYLLGLRKADVATQCAVPMTLKATQATVNPRSTRTVGIQTTSATNQQLVDFGAVSWRRDLTTSSWR